MFEIGAKFKISDKIWVMRSVFELQGTNLTGVKLVCPKTKETRVFEMVEFYGFISWGLITPLTQKPTD